MSGLASFGKSHGVIIMSIGFVLLAVAAGATVFSRAQWANILLIIGVALYAVGRALVFIGKKESKETSPQD